MQLVTTLSLPAIFVYANISVSILIAVAILEDFVSNDNPNNKFKRDLIQLMS